MMKFWLWLLCIEVSEYGNWRLNCLSSECGLLWLRRSLLWRLWRRWVRMFELLWIRLMWWCVGLMIFVGRICRSVICEFFLVGMYLCWLRLMVSVWLCWCGIDVVYWVGLKWMRSKRMEVIMWGLICLVLFGVRFLVLCMVFCLLMYFLKMWSVMVRMLCFVLIWCFCSICRLFVCGFVLRFLVVMICGCLWWLLMIYYWKWW